MRSAGRFLLVGALMSTSCRCSKEAPVSNAPPACRLEKASPVLERTAAEALRRIRETSTPVVFSKIAVNASRSDANTLPVYLVKDAAADAVDEQGCLRAGETTKGPLDSRSIRGICVAEDQRILCSADAIASVLDAKNAPSIVSPFLLYLFLHELGHIALHHPGALGASGVVLDLSAPRAEKLSKLSTECLVDDDQLAREQAADQIAFDAMPKAFREPPFSTGHHDSIAAYVANSESAYLGAQRVLSWESPRERDDSETVQMQPTDDLCDVLAANTSQLHIPALGGDHPHIWRRLGVLMFTLSNELAKVAASNELPHDLRETFDELRNDAFDANLQNFGLEATVRRLCRTVKEAQKGALDCSADAVAKRRWIHTDDLTAVGFHSGDEKSLPVTVPAPRAHHEPTTPTGIAMAYSNLSSAGSEDVARTESTKLVEQLSSFLAMLDQRLEQTGGYIVWISAEPVTWKPDPFSGGLEIHAQLSLLIRADAGFDPRALDEWKRLPNHGRAENELKSASWPQVGGSAVIHFFRPSDADHAPGERLLSRDMPIEAMFDLDAARAGRPNTIAAAFHRMLCYAHVRIEAADHQKYELRPTKPDGAFYFNSSLRYLPPTWDSNFPASWAPLASTDCPDVSRRDPALISTLATLFRGPAEVDRQMFARIFDQDIPAESNHGSSATGAP